MHKARIDQYTAVHIAWQDSWLGMQVCDLFCGLGGFSAGAIEAGAEVILGVDRDSVSLKLWAANVPSGRAKLATLGGACPIDLPPSSPSLHLHLSPPHAPISLLPAVARSRSQMSKPGFRCLDGLSTW